jgi:hypothetical protein
MAITYPDGAIDYFQSTLTKPEGAPEPIYGNAGLSKNCSRFQMLFMMMDLFENVGVFGVT